MTDNKIKLIIVCPHCHNLILIEQLNCCIFRHGTLKENGEQIDPHASKEMCDNYIKRDKIYGCGYPFKIVQDISTNSYVAIKCEYI